VTDESKLDRDIGRGQRAQDLIDNELLNDSFKALEDAYMAAWRVTNIEDVAAREKLFLAVNIVGKIKDHLGIIATNGKLAMAEIKQIAEAAERKKRFGLV
jgi:hypothetical protein